MHVRADVALKPRWWKQADEENTLDREAIATAF